MDSAKDRRGLPDGVAPFGDLRIRLLPTTRSFSQVAASFVASRCQGIHHALLLAWPKNLHRGWGPRPAPRSLSRFPPPTNGLVRMIEYPNAAPKERIASVTLAFNCQRSHRCKKLSDATAMDGRKICQRLAAGIRSRLRLARSVVPGFGPALPLVEKIGIEPTTSGLQSRRSPN